MLKKIALALVVALAVLAGIVATRPGDYRVERSATVAAPPEVVFGLVGDFRSWVAWSPWEALDPAMKKTFGGQAGEIGSTYAWQGNDQVGAGQMTVIDKKSSSQIDIKLEFIKPWPSVNQTTFRFAPAGDKTTVTWIMAGHNGFVEKAMTLFMDMDKMIGADFDKGLAKLGEKAQAEHGRLVAEAQKKAAEEAAQRAAAEAALRKAAEEAAQAAATPPATPQKKS